VFVLTLLICFKNQTDDELNVTVGHSLITIFYVPNDRCSTIEPVHLLFALLNQYDSTVRYLLNKSDIDINKLRSQLGGPLKHIAKVVDNNGGYSRIK
jgi:ATP-dependent Clp protease ATP-binding subunit ClpA